MFKCTLVTTVSVSRWQRLALHKRFFVQRSRVW